MMPRTLPEWRGATLNSMPPPRVRARIFERHEGRDHTTGRKIRAGEAWQLDHVIALCNGGLNIESNLAPILSGKPHKEKTAADVAEKSKVARMRAKHLGIRTPSRMQGSRNSPLKKKLNGKVVRR